jgi:hypothetical protein
MEEIKESFFKRTCEVAEDRKGECAETNVGAIKQ